MLTSQVRAECSRNKILVIDDDSDEVSSELLNRELRQRGVTMDVYFDPIKAIGDFKPGNFGLILVGGTEGAGMSRFEAIRRLRRIDSNSRVCLMTRLRVESDELHLLFPDLGVVRILQKPVSPEDIVWLASQSSL